MRRMHIFILMLIVAALLAGYAVAGLHSVTVTDPSANSVALGQNTHAGQLSINDDLQTAVIDIDTDATTESIPPIPEPESLLLFGVGVCGAVLARRFFAK